MRGCTPTLISDLSKDANNSQVPEAETAIFMAAVDSPVLSRFLPPARPRGAIRGAGLGRTVENSTVL